MHWQPYAEALAATATPPGSRWRPVIASTPRHPFVPRWWTGGAEWELRDGPSAPEEWLATAYSDRSLVTQIGTSHADHAEPGARATGRPTSSSTLPTLVVQMLRHASIGEGCTVLDVGTGSGYGTAVLCARLGDRRVTSIDVDPYLSEAAEQRLDRLGHQPRLITGDATGRLDGRWDRIVASVSVRPVPASWLEVLTVGGRLATTITNMGIILTAERQQDGSAVGRIERDQAMFMPTRAGARCLPPDAALLEDARTAEGDAHAARFPVLDVVEAWEVRSMLEILAPGIVHHYERNGDTRVGLMLHEDGSWARAEQAGHAPPVVTQAGPRRLWDLLDQVRDIWLREGQLPLHGALARIHPDGTISLRRGRWSATIDR